MPRRKKEPHLLLRKVRYDRRGRVTHQSTWIIRDGERHVATGCGVNDFAAAELKLHDYNIAKHAAKSLTGPNQANHVLIADLIAYYLKRKEDWIAGMPPERKRALLVEIGRLNAFWGGKNVAEINEETSLKYQRGRNKHSVRSELEVLRAVINFGEKKGKVDKGGRSLDYAMPAKAKSRVTFYTRREIALLVLSAYRRKDTVHIARFILTGLYTGTRSERIERASYIREPGRPWVDLENGVFYRRADGEMTPANKRADPVRIPRPLLMHMRRWHKGAPGRPGSRYVVEYRGRPVSPRKGFYTLKGKIFDKERRREVNRHTLRHTCATWLMQAGVSISLVAKYLSATEKIIEEVYGHHHPDFHSEADHAFSRGKAGRMDEQSRQKRPGQSRIDSTDDEDPA
ncbi:tyrosine-type recombinase/integrase [Rhizobium ruizarguesonis]|uniref:tyrosine-type recombinase/integrase n=1 Tax=Rhizobium ruizarguesonis TaxID=2081791 RepID=UPI00103AA1CA|nr:tyrosine-type recombinase/integrase [Rhizobium ruizarguesonis]MBY5892973.1 tyrosine-type recombinase/integrase [Rhizobium leguminosarum]NEH78161.1 tyrosine-type recombinase/integrase [Rhizobium ruizarguesonis]TBY54432.1 integrase [Rhizobium leguminosarum bv. viciae]